ncbi:MAG: hypothetical protein Q9186_002522 [Xanthomendoza sp. 1 TL-2023]
MPSATSPNISADDIDDLLYLARTNDLEDLRASIEAVAQAQRTSPENIIIATIDPETGNGLLHMASANGCMDVLKHLLRPNLSVPSSPNLNLPNSSGNTPLHWAALNGRLDAVKILIGAGADPAIRNNAGHDAVYEAERSEKEQVVEWLLREGQDLESGIAEGSATDEEVKGQGEITRVNGANTNDDGKNGMTHVQEELGCLKMEEKGDQEGG